MLGMNQNLLMKRQLPDGAFSEPKKLCLRSLQPGGPAVASATRCPRGR